MTQFLDIENKFWDSVKEGTIREFSETSEIPVTVYLQWFEGGWNRIYEVRIGAVNAGSENQALAEEYLGVVSELDSWSISSIAQVNSKFAKDSLKPKSPYFSNVPIDFLDKIPTIVAGVQRDIEGTRQAVQLLRDEYKRKIDYAHSFGDLNKYWQEADERERAIVAFKLKELLYQSGVRAYRNVAFELLSFKNKNGELISLPTFNRLSTKGERLVRQKNTPKGVKK